MEEKEMSNRLDKEREEKLQPKRMEIAVREIEKLGYEVNYKDGVKIHFWFNGAAVTFYPYSGWATGRTIKDGRGLKNLLKQLK